jgi:hypothetical protein
MELDQLNPSAMNIGATVTAGPPDTVLATSLAVPTMKAPPKQGA